MGLNDISKVIWNSKFECKFLNGHASWATHIGSQCHINITCSGEDILMERDFYPLLYEPTFP